MSSVYIDIAVCVCFGFPANHLRNLNTACYAIPNFHLFVSRSSDRVKEWYIWKVATVSGKGGCAASKAILTTKQVLIAILNTIYGHSNYPDEAGGRINLDEVKLLQWTDQSITVIASSPIDAHYHLGDTLRLILGRNWLRRVPRNTNLFGGTFFYYGKLDSRYRTDFQMLLPLDRYWI